jgi:HAE1 family hydrophobic/amphiphilic exporter-1
MKLIDASVSRPITTLMVYLSLLVFGIISLYRLPLEFFPSIDFPYIQIMLSMDSSIPSQVEKEITIPVEETLSTLSDIKEMNSSSGPGFVWVGVELNWGVDINLARMDVREKIERLRPQLPRTLREINIFTWDSNDIPIIFGRISSNSRDLSTQYDFLDQHVVKPFKRGNGVAKVELWGAAEKTINIDFSQEKLKRFRISTSQVVDALLHSNVGLSLGTITDDDRHLSLRVVNEFQKSEDFADTVISPAGIRLRDVARVAFEDKELSYIRRLNGEKTIAFGILKESNANTVAVCRAIQAKIEAFKQDPLTKDLDFRIFFNQADQITESIKGLKDAGVTGSIMAIILLFLFLRNIPATIAVSLAIPLSVISTFAFLYLNGNTLNIITMMGLMLGVGMLVDNAVVVIESIFRLHTIHGNARQASIVGTQEVGMAILASTLTSVIVFLPIIFGRKNQFTVWLAQVGLTITVSLLFSLVISLTLIPLFTSRFLHQSPSKEAWMVLVTQRLYARMLGWTLNNRFITMVIILLVGASAIYPHNNLDKSPSADSMAEKISVQFTFTGNVTKEASQEYIERMEAILLKNKAMLELESVYSYASANQAQMDLYFVKKFLDKYDQIRLRKKVETVIPEMPGAKISVSDEGGGSSHSQKGVSEIQIRLFGDDMETIKRFGLEIKQRLGHLEGFRDLDFQANLIDEELQVVMKQEKAREYGFSPQVVANVVGAAFRGVPLPRLKSGEKEVDVTLRLNKAERDHIGALDELSLPSRQNLILPLGVISAYQYAPSWSSIDRIDRKVNAVLKGTYEGKSKSKFMDKLKEILGQMKFPEGMYYKFSREDEDSASQIKDLIINMSLAIIMVYLVMAALFESLAHPFAIMSALPLAYVGVAWMLYLCDTALNVMAIIGMTLLIGVVVNNGIVMIDHINNYRRQGRPRHDAVISGSVERLRPILMTALTTILGLIPMALERSDVGGATYYPLALATIGGMTSSTFLSLLALPALYLLVDDFGHYLAAIFSRASFRFWWRLVRRKKT